MDNVIINSIEVRAQKPLEAKRGPVNQVEELYDINTWAYDEYTDNDGSQKYMVYAYNGMVVPVISPRELWMLIDVNNITTPGSWVKIGGTGGGDVIYDGGSARDVYLGEQIIDAGDANSASD